MADDTTPAPAATGISRADLEALFYPEKEQEDIDSETLEANIARALKDPHYVVATRKLRESYDRVLTQAKADRAKEDVLASQSYKMVCMGGPDQADTFVIYLQPKKAAAAGVSEIPVWTQYISRAAVAHIYKPFMDEIDRLLGPARQETLANCSGLPAEAVDHHSFFDLSGKFQFNYVTSDERWDKYEGKDKDGKDIIKKVPVSLGGRVDKFRPDPKPKAVTPAAAPSAPAVTAATPAPTAPVPPAE